MAKGTIHYYNDFEEFRDAFGGMDELMCMLQFNYCIQMLRYKYYTSTKEPDDYADNEWIELTNIRDFLGCYLACKYCNEHHIESHFGQD